MVVKLTVPKNDTHGFKFRVVLVHDEVRRMIYEVHRDDVAVCVLIT